MLVRQVQPFRHATQQPGDLAGKSEAQGFLAKILNAVEFRDPAQSPGQVVGPAVIAAAQLGGLAFRLIDDLSRPMPGTSL